MSLVYIGSREDGSWATIFSRPISVELRKRKVYKKRKKRQFSKIQKMKDLNQWKNFQDYEDELESSESIASNYNWLIILGVSTGVAIGLAIMIYMICRKFGFPITCRDICLCFRRQISELRGWMTGREIEPVFQPEVIEMVETNHGDESRCYSSIVGNLRSSWPLMTQHESNDSWNYESSRSLA